MKKLLIVLTLFTIGIFSCNPDANYIRVEKNIKKDQVIVYFINTAGAIKQSTDVYPYQIIEALTDDIDRDYIRYGYTIKSLSIKSVNISIEKRTGNTANSVKIASFITKGTNPSATPLIDAHDFMISDFSILSANGYLATIGVDEVNEALKDALEKTGGTQPMHINISGNAVPANAKVAIELILHISFNIEYSYCEQTETLIIDPLSSCI